MRKSKRIKLFSITLIAFCIIIRTAFPVFAEESIRLAYNGDPETLAPWKLVHLVTDEMFRRINIKLEYKVLPAKRAGYEANKGDRYDGDNARVYEYNKRFPNLMRVEESIYTQVLAAYAIDPDISLNSWDSLRGTEYKVEYLRGIVFVEMNLSKVVSPKNLSIINRRELGLKKLAAGRTDLYVDVQGLITSLLNQDEFKNSKIKQVGVMHTNPLYLYLHKKHAALIPKLKEALIQIKSEGLYDDYQQQVFGKKD